VTQVFEDSNTGPSGIVAIQVRTTPAIIASFFDMNGPANMLNDVAKLRVPILWISGSRDPSQLPRESGFNRAPNNAQSRYLQIDAAHIDTPEKAANDVVAWIRDITK
jgi:pimeloyl-ACP methyl ester carboxylesterase